MFEHHVDAGELDEAEEVLDVELPSCDESSEVVHPGEEPFDLPALLVTAELPLILRFASIAAVRGDHLDAIFVLEALVEFVGVVSLVSDQSGRELVEKASGKNLLHKLALGRRSALDRYGERKTVTSGDSDDLTGCFSGADGLDHSTASVITAITRSPFHAATLKRFRR